MKMMMTIAAAALMLAASPADETIGAGVTLADATPIAALVKAPKEFVGKKVRVDGIATAVCEEMGCWMAVADSDKKGAPVVRLKVEHEGAIVFPMSAKGKRVSAEGVFQSVGGGDEHAREAASEHAKQDANASGQYQISATGAIIK